MLHITLVVSAGATPENADPSVAAEQRSLEAAARYAYEVSGYAAVQTTRPRLIAYGLTDSPVFHLAWLVDLFKNWTDAAEVPEDAVDRDALLTNVMLYWLTGTGGLISSLLQRRGGDVGRAGTTFDGPDRGRGLPP